METALYLCYTDSRRRKGGICIITVQSITLNDSKEESLPSFAADFPYIATCAELDKYLSPVVPWHWHPTVELFYVKSGTVEYRTPSGTWTFPTGSGGFVNVNVLHSSRIIPSGDETVQLLHIFSPDLLSDGYGNRIDSTYIRPLIHSGIDVIPLSAENPSEATILEKLLAAFAIENETNGYEMLLRQALSEIWLGLFCLVQERLSSQAGRSETHETVKAMLTYMHEHCADPIRVDDIAAAAHVSKRVCFRLFREQLQTSPVEYLTDYRLRKACALLRETKESVTDIAHTCGFSSGSYLSHLFALHFSSSPLEYRKQWHDHDKNEQ